MLSLPDSDLHGKARLHAAAMELDFIPAVAGGNEVDATERALRLWQHGIIDIPAVSLQFGSVGARSGSRYASFFGDDMAHRMSEHLLALACVLALDPDLERAATGL